MAYSRYIDRLTPEETNALRERLHTVQSHVCFICRESIDLQLHDGSLEFDHIEPLAVGGKDTEINLALTHSFLQSRERSVRPSSCTVYLGVALVGKECKGTWRPRSKFWRCASKLWWGQRRTAS